MKEDEGNTKKEGRKEEDLNLTRTGDQTCEEYKEPAGLRRRNAGEYTDTTETLLGLLFPSKHLWSHSY